ncbi:MAG: cytochrome c biogenesis protein ResB [Actinobacteria bacterium]|nr:cytochrome c biogenesis protein ResB [Actinomycetota bacterium]
MRTALFLLLMLAVAAVPGSLYPQRSADPNGVRFYYDSQPEFAAFLDSLQLFDVYTSVWFSAIYILLFVSLVGCVLPRTKIHWHAVRSKPVKTPVSLARMPQYRVVEGFDLVAAEEALKRNKFRFEKQGESLSAEKGYLKETGNLVFHYSLIGVLIAVGLGGGFAFSGQRVLVEGDSFVNNLASYDSFAPGPLFYEGELEPFTLKLDKFNVVYDLTNPANIGQPIDFIADVTLGEKGSQSTEQIRVNYPLEVPGANVYLTGNGFAPVITVFDGKGNIAYSGPVVFLPQDGNMTSLGVVKVPDALPKQIGIIAFFYPTAEKLESGAYTSIYPDPIDPLLTMNVYTGDLGLDGGVPRNVYALDTTDMDLVAGRNGPAPALELRVGEQAELPNGLGTVRFDGLLRFASVDIAHNPGGIWVLIFSLIALVSVTMSLMIPRRRVWFRATSDGKIEVAALARGDDPGLSDLLDRLVLEIKEGKK